MTTMFDELQLVHGGDTDFQLNQIINDADSCSTAKEINSTTSTITFKSFNTESEECEPKSGLCLDCNQKLEDELKSRVAVPSLLTLSLITQFLTSVVAHNSSEHIAEWKGMSYKYLKTATESVATKLFVCIEFVKPMLYWYNQFHGYLTSKKTFICPIGLSNGHVLVAMWRTRCNKLTIHGVMYNPSDDTCYMITTMSEWMKLHFDPSVVYDVTKVQRFSQSRYKNWHFD